MKRTVVWLTDRQVKALAGMPKRCVAPVSALVRQAVDVYLQKIKKRSRCIAPFIPSDFPIV
jgi:hypothetical protein